MPPRTIPNRKKAIILVSVVFSSPRNSTCTISCKMAEANPYQRLNWSAFLITTYVTITDNDVSFNDLSAGASDTGVDYDFDVSSNCPAGTVLTFNVTLTADEGTWNCSFNITVTTDIGIQMDGFDPPTCSDKPNGKVYATPLLVNSLIYLIGVMMDWVTLMMMKINRDFKLVVII